MTFTVKKGDFNANHQLVFSIVPGDFVFPFSWSAKLDEALDEAAVVCYNSTVEKYSPNTNWKIELADGLSTKTLLFKLANDESEEYPIASGTYKHTFSFVEMTKYLEGVMCPTMTFTNTVGKQYSQISCKFTAANGSVVEEGGNAFSHPSYVTPIQSNTFTIPSAENMSATYKQWELTYGGIEGTFYDSYFDVDAQRWYYSRCTYSGNNVSGTTSSYSDSPSVRISNNLTATYTLIVSWDGGSTKNVFTISTNLQYADSKSTKKWTIASVCDRIFDICEPLQDTSGRRFNLTADAHTRLDKILAPEFAITQSTLREALRTVGGKIHSEPRIVSIAGRTNETLVYTVDFEPYCKSIDSSIGVYVKRAISHNLADYSTRLYSNAKNVVNSLSAANVITDPGKDSYKSVRAEQVNVRINEENAVASTSFPIYDLVSVLCGIYNVNGNNILTPKDITAFCFEATEYDSVLSSFSGTYPSSKEYGIRWQRGQKNITELFYEAPNAVSQVLSKYSIANILASVTSGETPTSVESKLATDGNQLVFRIKYKPIVNTALVHGKNTYTKDEEYTTSYGQCDSLVELDYFGENLRGAAARTGNADISLTSVFANISQIPQIGNRVEVEDEDYYISSVTNRMNAENIFSTISLTKDFNRISQYIGIDSKKRISEIPTEQAYDRDIVVPAKLVVGNVPNPKLPLINIPISVYADMFFDASVDRTVSQAVIFRKVGAQEADKVCLPAVASGYGCTTVLSASMKDNFAADQAEKYISGGQIKGFWGYDFQFGDYFGRAEKIGIEFISSVGVNRKFAFTYPAFPNYSQDAIVASCNPYLCRKDSRERLATISFSIEAQTTIPGVTVGSALAKRNLLVKSKAQNLRPRLYWYGTGDEFPYKLSETIIGSDYNFNASEEVEIENVTYYSFNLAQIRNTATSPRRFVIAFPAVSETISVVNEAGETETQTIQTGGEILFICNKYIPPNGYALGTSWKFQIVG